MQIGFVLRAVDEGYPAAMRELERLAGEFEVLPFIGREVLDYQGRYGDAHEVMRDMQRICDHPVTVWPSYASHGGT